MIEQPRRVGGLEIVAGIFLLGLEEDVAIGDLVLALAAIEVQVEHAVDALHIHGKPFEPIRDLARHGIAIEAADLLEVSELRYLHAVTPHLPAEPPGAERRALPVVLDEADVMAPGIDADGTEALKIEILDVGRRWLQGHLELVILLEPVRVLAVAPVLGSPRWLHIGRAPG